MSATEWRAPSNESMTPSPSYDEGTPLAVTSARKKLSANCGNSLEGTTSSDGSSDPAVAVLELLA